MSTTPQMNAINGANEAVQSAERAYQLLASIDDIAYRAGSTAQNWPATWATMKTAPLNPDGSQSTVDDASPNPANPLSGNAYPTLKAALTPAQLTAILTAYDALVASTVYAQIQAALIPVLPSGN